MKIKVEYWAQLKQAAGVASEEIELTAAVSLADLATRLASGHDAAFRNLLLDDAGRPRVSNVVMVNGQMARWEDGRMVREGDVVTLLSPISGG